MTPINPESIKEDMRTKKIQQAVEFLNSSILRGSFHHQISVVDGYEAFLIPYNVSWIDVMEEVVNEFRKSGWDCKFSGAYDARGPHYCFYVNKKHFI